MSKFLDDNGEIAREDFIKFSQDSKLLDFGNVMGEGGVRGLSVMAATAGVSCVQPGGTKKVRGRRGSYTSRHPHTSHSLLCCCLNPRDQGGHLGQTFISLAFSHIYRCEDCGQGRNSFQQV